MTRYRCTACGNLTRFDVTTTRRTRAFHHYTVGGELTVEDDEVLAEDVESVECRWCGSAASAVEINDDDVTDGTDVTDDRDRPIAESATGTEPSTPRSVWSTRRSRPRSRWHVVMPRAPSVRRRRSRSDR